MSEQSLKPGWKMVKFGEVVKNANLVERDPEANDIERIVGLEHIDPENLHIRRWNSVADGTSFTRKFVPGQTLFGKRRAYQRKVAYAEFEGICSGDILTFEPKNRKVLLPELLPFICQSDAFFDHALDTSAGSLSPRTSWTALKDFEFPLPPLDEQKRIAEILWATDEAVSAYQEALNHIHIAAQIRLEHTLNTLNCSELSLPDVLSGSPESGCSAPPSSDETGHWVLSLAALSANGYVRGNLKPVAKTKKMIGATLSKGDLLISRSNTVELVGFAGIFNEDRTDVSFPDTMMRLPVNTQKALPDYLELVLLSNRGRRHMMKTASGTSSSMKKINRKTLAEFRFPVPDLDTQKRIVSEFNEQKKHREAIANHVSKTQRMLSLFSNETIGAAHV
ncbi:type I restriction enzyme, S subunit [Desulfomicrobium norvegicum]|jgi:type I restriction enzyme S subunit|uniref:Type I restriction enzyme, S subunit n=1 Tax=Desulfomicrobium norvegicum (strain DSM 1741 / NCIMB 8310) TaxID=52561 RepID=A0A8G2C444_DESNO|nr:restriction endonuclease subunit S [Desulfomicrobium norvegicum]SFL91831.1 type I restriction enzyme, S subunit [Desulfomicrobium norvegicum]